MKEGRKAMCIRRPHYAAWSAAEFLALKHESRILGHSSNPVCGFSMMEQVILCAVWHMENWLGSSLNQLHGWTTVQESYFRASTSVGRDGCGEWDEMRSVYA